MRGIVLGLVLLAAPLGGCTLGDFPADAGDVTVRSATIQPGESIPRQHTCDGPGTSPPLTFGDLPTGTETIALVGDDPDAPGEEPYVHWLVWNVPISGGSSHLPEGSVPDGALEGTNSAGGLGYTGPCPPKQDGAHTYRFAVYAVDRTLELEEGAQRAELEAALEGRVLGEGRLSASYGR